MRLQQRGVGMRKVSDLAVKMGVTDNMAPVLAMALGAGETTPFKLTSAYAEWASDLDEAAQAKDKVAALEAHGKLAGSCMACHREHREMRKGMGGMGGPPGSRGPGPCGGFRGPRSCWISCTVLRTT